MRTDRNATKITPETLCNQIGGANKVSIDEALEILLFLRKMALIAVTSYLEQ